MCDPEALIDPLEDELQSDQVGLASVQRPREQLLRILQEAFLVAFPVGKEEDAAYQRLAGRQVQSSSGAARTRSRVRLARSPARIPTAEPHELMSRDRPGLIPEAVLKAAPEVVPGIVPKFAPESSPEIFPGLAPEVVP